MALHDPSPKLTYEDYLLFPDDGKRHEIIGGEHFVTAAPFVRHQRLVGTLYFHIRAFLRLHPFGEILLAPTDVILSPHDIVQPDLFFISNERGPIVTEANIQGAPDLVIEILSNSSRRLDEVLKRKAYEEFGAREYWIFDPVRKTTQVWERTDEGLRRRTLLSAAAGDILTTALLPGLEIPLEEIFEDRLPREA
ncbi:MAG TPA: Uma2 family endonuclease [Thermoanaerobaculia bacterium]|jgi:Uma2 family endonuclease|nr:Uma2 family endonuclease [Thermoanaerobaculia bacterium]